MERVLGREQLEQGGLGMCFRNAVCNMSCWFCKECARPGQSRLLLFIFSYLCIAGMQVGHVGWLSLPSPPDMAGSSTGTRRDCPAVAGLEGRVQR